MRLKTRRVRRVATPISPSPSARVSSWRRSVSTCPRLRRRGDRMKRRQLLMTGPAAIAWMAVRPALPQQATVLGIIAGSVAADAQQGGKTKRIGYIGVTDPASTSYPAEKRNWASFLEGLREYGWVEGQNLLIESRWAEGQLERFGRYAA